jgi:Fe-S cluster assembly protein SufD
MVQEEGMSLSSADVAALSEKHNEPAWLREKRQQAWALAESLPLPTMDEEAWKRTDTRSVQWENIMKLPTQAGTLKDVPEALYRPLIGDKQGGLLVYADGTLVKAEFNEALAKQGVIFSDLHEAATKHADLLQKVLMTEAVLGSEDKIAALSAALWTHGVFVYVPRNVAVELPLHSVEYVTGTQLTSTHLLIVLEEGASVTYLHESVSPRLDVQTLHLGATEILVRDNADLRYVALQNWGEHVVNFGHQRARAGQNARIDWVAGELGTRLTKLFMTLDLDGDGAWGRLSGLYFPHNNQHLDLDTQQNHHARSTTSDLLFKGALRGHSRSVWQGMIVADVGAQKTDGFQANRNLILEPAARADSIPGLEILANDLRCTHASTVGQVDETEMFYLMSRGIPRNEALKLIVDGFFDPLLQRIPFEEVRDRLKASIDQMMEG